MAQAISREGDKAEELFLQLVSASRRSSSAAMGDAVVTVDGKDVSIEVKKCSSDRGIGTINQVRAIKFIPLVVYNPAIDRWYVVPATELVRFATQKSRGQHTEIPYESMNIGLGNIGDWECDPRELGGRLIEAVRFDRANERLKAAMSELLQGIKEAREEYRVRVDGDLGGIARWPSFRK